MKLNHLFLSILLICFCACQNAETKTEIDPPKKIKIDDQGVVIDYTDSQQGDTVLIFIHGWGINKTYWRDQVDYFSKKYRVIALDLPGFGQSGKNRASWTVEGYGKDVSAVLTKLDLHNVVLIGHSMSGAIIAETALTNPDRILAIIGIDNLKFFGTVETPKDKTETEAFFKQARANYKKTVSDYVSEALFSPSTDSIVRKRVVDDITRCDSVIALDCLEQNFKYPISEKVKSVGKTLYLINSSFIPTDTIAFRKNEVRYSLLEIGPTGHYPMVEKPAEFNKLLQQTLDRIADKLN